MSKIRNIEQLRDHALITLEKLASGDIDTTEAGVTGKLCESVISTIKAQLEYSRMIGEEPAIPFMLESQGTSKTINGHHEKKGLPEPKRKTL